MDRQIAKPLGLETPDAALPWALVTGGVHGYETSGVQGALRFLSAAAGRYTSRVNLQCQPTVVFGNPADVGWSDNGHIGAGDAHLGAKCWWADNFHPGRDVHLLVQANPLFAIPRG